MLEQRVADSHIRAKVDVFVQAHDMSIEEATEYLERTPDIERLMGEDKILGCSLRWTRHAIARGLLRNVSFESVSIIQTLKEADLKCFNGTVHVKDEELDRTFVVEAISNCSFVVVTTFRGTSSTGEYVWV